MDLKRKRRLFKRRKKLNRSAAGTFFSFIILFMLGLFMLLPFVFSVNNAFKPIDELFIYPPKLFVMNPTLNNFYEISVVMEQSVLPFSRFLLNSIIITVTGTVGHILIASFAAFILAKYDFPGNKLIFNLVVLSLMFVPQVTAIPNYLTMSTLGWIDTPLALIVPAFGSSLGLFLMKQFMETMIHDDILEIARVEGANIFQLFIKIVMPMVKPAWLTLAIFSIQNLWNIGGTTYILSDKWKTLPYALSQIVSGGIARAGVGSAVAVVIMIVPITSFVLSQTQIVETMSTSGIKG